MRTQRRLFAAVFLGLITLLLFNQILSMAQPTDLLISEYIEGSGNNQAIEIFNGSGQAINLETGAYNVQFYFDGNSAPGVTIPLTGATILEAGSVFVLAHSGAVFGTMSIVNQFNGGPWFDGNDAVVLRKGGIVLDVVGQIGVNPGPEWGTGYASTLDNTLRRKSHIEAGFSGSGPFYPATEWNGFPIDTFDGIGQHDPSPFLSSTSPISGATEIPVDSLVLATFTEPVTATDFEVRYFNFERSVSGAYRAQGNSLVFTPDSPMPHSTLFSAILIDIQDLNGNPFVGDRAIFGSTGNYLWKFTTEAGPSPFPQVSFEQANYTVNENGATVLLAAMLSKPSTNTITVDVATIEGSATGADFVPLSDTIIFVPGTITQTMEVVIIDDLLDEADETFTVALSNPQYAILGEPDRATVTIIDNNDPAPAVRFSAADYNALESAGELPITVTLSAASGLAITVDYATADGTATAGQDYIVAAGSLNFEPGQTAMTFTVSISDDAVAEPDETIALSLTNPVNAVPGNPSTATITLLNDDDDKPQVSFEHTGYKVNEYGGEALLRVVLSKPSTDSVSVNVATIEGSATGVDFIPLSNTIVFSAGVVTQAVGIVITDDLLDEADETFTVALSNPQYAVLGEPNVATVTIMDNDNPPTVHFSAADYNAPEAAGNLPITVTLSAASGLAIAVDYATADGTATAGEDYITATGSLNFAPGQTAMVFTVSINDDAIVEADETVSLSLTNPVNATPGSPSTATMTILNDDTPNAGLLINEIDSDQTGFDRAVQDSIVRSIEPPPPTPTPTPSPTPSPPDTRELIELYDGGDGNTLLNGYVVVLYDGSNNASYAAFDLDGYSTDSNGYFVLGNAAITQANIIFPDGLLQDGEDAVALYRGDAAGFLNGTVVTTTNLIDAIVYETGADSDSGLPVLLNPGEPVVDESRDGTPEIYSLQRCPNGAGGPRNTSTYTQANPSPGGPNKCTRRELPREEGRFLTYLPLILRYN